MLIFLSAVGVVLVVSFLCSIFESVLLSLTRPQIEVLGREHGRAARLLSGFKENMDVPIAAILILNTAAHTIGAAVAGASYSNVFDPATLWIFSIVFTLAVLLLTEIIPKTLGARFWRQLALPSAVVIRWLVRLLFPLVWVSACGEHTASPPAPPFTETAPQVRAPPSPPSLMMLHLLPGSMASTPGDPAVPSRPEEPALP